MYRFVSDETLMHIARAVGGDEGGEILKVLRDVKEITIYELTDRTGIQINTVRKLLHKFYNHSIVTCRRFRDKDTGWFIFLWRLQPELFEAFIRGLKQKILKKLQTRLEYELRHVFYRCGSSKCPKITFEEAMETIFQCPVCNDSLRPVDNSTTIRFLKRKIAQIEEELSK